MGKTRKDYYKKDKFIDLGDSPMEFKPTKNDKKWYPSIRVKKDGFRKGIGKIGTALVKFKVRSIELREGQEPETCLDITGIKEQE